MGEPGGLLSMGSHRVGHNWSDLAAAAAGLSCNTQDLSVQFSHSVMSDSLRPHESQHARPPCSLPSPGIHSDSHPSSPWCHPAISHILVFKIWLDVFALWNLAKLKITVLSGKCLVTIWNCELVGIYLLTTYYQRSSNERWHKPFSIT